MVSARTGGVAVAVGIGYAVAFGAGVAAADPSDGSSGSDSSPTSSSSSESKSESGAGPSAPSAAKAAEPSSSVSAQSTATKAKADDAATESDEKPAKPAKKKREAAADTTSESKADTTPDADAEAPKTEVPQTDETVEATAAVTETVTEKHSSEIATKDSPAEPPAAPADALAVATLASASRREVADPTPVVAQANSLAQVSKAEATPSVVAIEQIPPLGFLQQIPVLGPAFITPVVALIHQIPIAGDILHTFVGYPVQWGLPPGAPQSRDVKVVSFDGTQIYVHFMPASGLVQGAKAPTVLDGPGLGVTGATNLDGTFLDPILADTVGMLSPGTLRRAGYNVVTWDPRGEYSSGGTLELNAAEFEGQDMSAIIDWIATQPEVLLDSPGDPRLGMVGVSYGGGIQLVTAAGDKRVDAIVPAIAYNRLDTSLYKSGAFKTSWATALTAVLEVLGGRINPSILPAAINGDLTGDLSPEDLALFLSRNPKIGDITVPTLLVHGTVDTLFSLAEADATATTLIQNGVTTKVIWFCGGHGVCANNLFDLSDGVLIQERTLEWLDKYVKQTPGVDTGPQFEWVDQRGQWYSSTKYPVTKGASLDATLAGDRTLPLIPYLGGSGIPFVPYALGAPNAVNLKIPASTATTYLVGAPSLTMTYSGTGSATHVYAQLVDDQTGMVLGAIVTPVPLTLDGASHDITIDLEPVSHTLRPGETVTLQIVGSAGMYQTIVPDFGTLDISSVHVSVPTADPAAVTPFSVGDLSA